jgi:hypothetical protein
MHCLPTYLADKFLQQIRSGEITPDKLTDMTSQERREFFAKTLGELNAKEVNTLFESKLLLKDQQRGMISWAKTTAGISSQTRKDIISRVEKMTEVLNPKEQDAFLEDIVAHKLGVTVTMEQAGNISELAKDTYSKRNAMEASERRKLNRPQTPLEKEYGDARVAFSNYVGDLKTKANKKSIYEYLKSPGTVVSELAGLAKSMKASLDNSVIGRQGLKILWTHPTIWYKNSIQTFIDAAREISGKKVLDSVMSDIVSRPNYDNMIKDKVSVGVTEEAFPTHLPGKIPGLGRLFKASEAAYSGFLQRTRADLYDLYTDIALKSGLEETTGIGLGKLVNSLTSRGSLGGLEPVAGTINNVFFAPRNLKANFDVLTAHTFSKDISPFVRKQAAINLLKIVSGTAATLALANTIWPDSVEKDPRSADFGKIKVGNTRFDVTGGMAGILTLAMRLLPTKNDKKWGMWTKSSTTGNITNLWSDSYRAPSGKDVVYDFFENKFSPASAVIKDILEGKDFSGKPISIKGELNTFITPLPISTTIELYNNPDSANMIISLIAEEFGINTNTYSGKKSNRNAGE